jgi:hypothetical protein
LRPNSFGAPRARRRPPPTQRTTSRSAQADRGPKALAPIEIGLQRRSAPGAGLRRHKGQPPGRRRPTAGRRPLEAEFIRRSAPGAGLRRRKGQPPGRRRPTAGRRPLEAEFIRRSAPGAGLRRHKGQPPGRRRPTAGRRPLEAEFIRRSAPGAGLRRRKGQPPGRRRPTAGRRLSRLIEIGLQRRSAPGVGLRRRKGQPPGRRRPTAGRRPLEAEFIRRTPRRAPASADAKDILSVGAGRPPAGGPLRPNSFGAQADHRPKASQAEPIRRAPSRALTAWGGHGMLRTVNPQAVERLRWPGPAPS